VPAPSHRPASVAVEPEQLGATHTVPDAYLRQPRLPSQNPSVPQVAASPSAHWPSGSWPAGTSVQLPALPGSAHDRQVPVQVVLQQTPCSHRPELHSAALPHAPPSGFLPQLPFTQVSGGTQFVSLAQMTRHLPSLPHANGAHDSPAGGTHAPLPSQRDAAVSVDPIHDGGLHTEPDAYFRHAPAPSQTPSVPQPAMP
jgi:hypothetical protein